MKPNKQPTVVAVVLAARFAGQTEYRVGTECVYRGTKYTCVGIERVYGELAAALRFIGTQDGEVMAISAAYLWIMTKD